MTGFINVLKPPGMSSHDVISCVRRVLKIKRVGHAGTLDPAAAGVLPVAVGSAARLIEYLELAEKSYRAEVRLGVSTDSGDDTGAVLERRVFKMPDEGAIESVLVKFRGEIEQIPPAHSAIKIGGQKACDLVRRGEEVKIPARRVTISRLELLTLREDSFFVDIDCSKGTYIRTLCLDIGKALGIPACMSFLVRTRVGAFLIENALMLEEISARGEAALLPVEPYLGHLPRYELAEERRTAFLNGLPTGERQALPAGPLRVYTGGELLGIGHYDAAEKSIFPHKVILGR